MSATASRRTVLRAAGGALVVSGSGLLGACTGGTPTPGPHPSDTPSPDVDEAARRAAASTEQALADSAGATAAALRSNAAGPLLTLAASAHQAHAAALLEGLSPSTGVTPSASSRPTTATKLAAAQTAASGRHRAALPEVSGSLARLLACVAASDAAFAATLRAASR